MGSRSGLLYLKGGDGGLTIILFLFSPLSLLLSLVMLCQHQWWEPAMNLKYSQFGELGKMATTQPRHQPPFFPPSSPIQSGPKCRVWDLIGEERRKKDWRLAFWLPSTTPTSPAPNPRSQVLRFLNRFLRFLNPTTDQHHIYLASQPSLPPSRVKGPFLCSKIIISCPPQIVQLWLRLFLMMVSLNWAVMPTALLASMQRKWIMQKVLRIGGQH